MRKITNKITKFVKTHKPIILLAVVLVAVVAFWAPADATSTAKTTLASVTAAENQTYTSDGRLFVTGNNGIFEIVPGTNSKVTVVERAPKQSCGFGGIVQALGTIYVNCTANGTSYLYAATASATPTFKRIYTMKGTILANGLTADSSGRLYVASTFLNRILRLTPSASDPLTIARSEVWLNGAGTFTNGIKYANGVIYWTDSMFVRHATINADGSHGKAKTIFSALTYFDDMAVDNNGILVADYLGGKIRKYDLNGRATGSVSGLSGPSSVARARAPFPAGSLIVTERGANRVSLVTP